MYGNECISRPAHSTTPPRLESRRASIAGTRPDEKQEHFAPAHLRSELVPPRVESLAAAWQVWDSVQEGVGDTIHIDYDGEYGSERVLIVSGRATVVPPLGNWRSVGTP